MRRPIFSALIALALVACSGAPIESTGAPQPELPDDSEVMGYGAGLLGTASYAGDEYAGIIAINTDCGDAGSVFIELSFNDDEGRLILFQ